MDTRLLTAAAFKATFTNRMREITGGEHEAIDIWPYVDHVSPEDLGGLRLLSEEVKCVWRDAYDRWDHVLLALSRGQTYLVIVVDLREGHVHGHHVLDLGALYGDRSGGDAAAE